MGKKTILVTGGAGYIGSFMAKKLLDEQYGVVVADNLSQGSKKKVPATAVFRQGNLLDQKFLNEIFSEFEFDGVMHFAGSISVGESMKKPGMYFTNNVFSAVKLLDTMVEHKVKKFIFSSTGTVYGNPNKIPIPERHETNPDNPYAESKRFVEQILAWYHAIHSLNYTVLRYFNACGGALDGSNGEDHKPETHIIPNAIASALRNDNFSLYGVDYDTPDGTCIRDYIHVLDLVEAHMLALKRLDSAPGGSIYNVGTGKGYSNKQVIDAVKKISGCDFPVTEEKRRDGDTKEIVADITKITSELGFHPRYSDLTTIITTALIWHKTHQS